MAINPLTVAKYAKEIKDVVVAAGPLIEAAVPVAKQYAPQAKAAAVKVKDSAKVALGGIRSNIAEQKEKSQEAKAVKKEAKVARKATTDCRRRALEKASRVLDAKEYFRIFEENIPQNGEMVQGLDAMPGCYVILTLPNAVTKDLSNYKDVYVGCSSVLGFAAYQHLCGLGNVDVYADFKFKQPMRVLTYPCQAEHMDALLIELMRDLSADESYNSWDLVNEMLHPQVETELLVAMESK